ncbi:hypothetical protein IFM89_023221 [Coptis chinensis]|uniref:Uncharacterized protein n=1 Tax=Coptis chinensis TaxID=261450 RepID=A0A835M4L9_9MAGN|nr:hypothetical protein IFM89_023221 [Coptis chinensis]
MCPFYCSLEQDEAIQPFHQRRLEASSNVAGPSLRNVMLRPTTSLDRNLSLSGLCFQLSAFVRCSEWSSCGFALTNFLLETLFMINYSISVAYLVVFIQVLSVEELFKHRVSNVVFMGIGEPMLNLKSVLEAHRCLNEVNCQLCHTLS